jgi:hypothetical protein
MALRATAFLDGNVITHDQLRTLEAESGRTTTYTDRDTDVATLRSYSGAILSQFVLQADENMGDSGRRMHDMLCKGGAAVILCPHESEPHRLRVADPSVALIYVATLVRENGFAVEDLGRFEHTHHSAANFYPHALRSVRVNIRAMILITHDRATLVLSVLPLEGCATKTLAIEAAMLNAAAASKAPPSTEDRMRDFRNHSSRLLGSRDFLKTLRGLSDAETKQLDSGDYTCLPAYRALERALVHPQCDADRISRAYTALMQCKEDASLKNVKPTEMSSAQSILALSYKSHADQVPRAGSYADKVFTCYVAASACVLRRKQVSPFYSAQSDHNDHMAELREASERREAAEAAEKKAKEDERRALVARERAARAALAAPAAPAARSAKKRGKLKQPTVEAALVHKAFVGEFERGKRKEAGEEKKKAAQEAAAARRDRAAQQPSVSKVQQLLTELEFSPRAPPTVYASMQGVRALQEA